MAINGENGTKMMGYIIEALDEAAGKSFATQIALAASTVSISLISLI